MSEETRRTATAILAAITAKMQANIEIVEKSAKYGRLTWRTTRDGQVEVELEPKV